MGELSPVDGKEWSPPLADAELCKNNNTAGGPAGAPSKRPGHPSGPPPPPPGQRRTSAFNEVNNYRQHGFNNLPRPDENFALWKVDKLWEFFSVSLFFLGVNAASAWR